MSGAAAPGSPAGSHLYAVIDLAIAESLRSVLTARRVAAFEPLFSWTYAKELLEVGPWLVRLSDAPQVARALSEMGDDVPWGYYVQSPVDILSLRKSLRRYNLAQVPSSPRQVLFRYWDPRVMGAFLRVTTKFQRERLFEWIDHIDVAGAHFDRGSSNPTRVGDMVR